MQSSAPAPIPVATLSLVFKVLHNAVSNSSDLSKYGKINLESKPGGLDLDRVLPQ